MSTSRAPLQTIMWIAVVAVVLGALWALIGPTRREVRVTGGPSALSVTAVSDATEAPSKATVWPTVLPLDVRMPTGQSVRQVSDREVSLDPEAKKWYLKGGYVARVRVVRLYAVRYNSPDGREPTRAEYPDPLEFLRYTRRLYPMQLETVEAFGSETDAKGYFVAPFENELQGADPLDGRMRIGQEAVVFGSELRLSHIPQRGFEWLKREADAVGDSSGAGRGSYVPIRMGAMYVIDGDVARELASLTPYPLARVLASVQPADR